MPNKILDKIIRNRKNWLWDNAIQDWTEEDTIHVAETYAKEQISVTKTELLDALKVCYKSLCTYGNHPIVEKQVQNAINKATE